MKKIIITITILFIINETKAATSPTDTLAYLQALYNRRSNFIGKPFSVLLDSLQIKIQYFSPTGALPYDISKETYTTFYFINPYDGDWGANCFTIKWQPYLDATVSDRIFTNSNGWNDEAARFYSTGIIKDIIASDDIINYVGPVTSRGKGGSKN